MSLYLKVVGSDGSRRSFSGPDKTEADLIVWASSPFKRTIVLFKKKNWKKLNQVAFEGSEGMVPLWPWKQGRAVFLVFIVINIAKNSEEENVEVSSSDYP